MKKFYSILVALTALWCCAGQMSATIYKVGAAWGTADGATIFATLQDFIDSCPTTGASTKFSTADEIWVQGGTHNISGAWTMQLNQAKLYGGFAGTETSADEREIAIGKRGWEFTNQTIITCSSGSALGSGMFRTNSSGSAHTPPALIDGFVVDGQGKNTCLWYRQIANGTSVTIQNCVFKNGVMGTALTTTSEACAGALNFFAPNMSGNSGNITINECFITGNTGNVGAIFFGNGTSGRTFTISNCLITDNEDLDGNTQFAMSSSSTYVTADAIIYLRQTVHTLNLTNVDFYGNTAANNVTNADNQTDVQTLSVSPAAHTITVSQANATTTPSLPATIAVSYGASISFTTTPDNGYVVSSVTYNSISLTPNADGVYTISDIIADGALIITTAVANNTVTVTTTGVTVTSPTLSNDQFSTGTTATITFTLNAGYESPSVTVDGDSYALDAPVNGVYTVSLTGLSGATTVTITASQIEYSIAKTESNATVSFTGGASAHYSDVVTGTVSVTSPYHSPYVSVDGVYTALDGNNQFTFTVTGNTTVAVTAFAENVIPVSEDTYIDGRSTTADNSLGKDIRAQASSSSYQRVSVLKFDVSGISSSSYNKAMLSFVIKNKQKTTKETLVAKEVIGYALTNAFSSINYSNSGTDLYNNASVISSELDPEITVTTDVNKQVEIDITGYVFGNLSDNLRVALTAGTSGVQDGTVFIHSLENGNADYVPQLVFSYEASTAIPTVIADDNAPLRYYNLQGIEVSAPVKGAIYIVRQGAKAKKVVFGKQ